MHRSHLLVVLMLLGLCAGGVILWLLSRTVEAPFAPPTETPVPAATSPASGAAIAAETSAKAPADATLRRAATGGDMQPVDDPEIRAALTGFRGRVVDHAKAPVADCGVRMYRGAIDSVLPAGVDFFAEQPTMVPDYVAGETRTGEDGTFAVHGVWPRGFYLLLAGIGTDAPSHRLLPRTPAPGEIIDLGDIVLEHAAVATGVVVDENNHPVADALVRGVDLPGQVLSFLPLERFDPQGCVLVREKSSPLQVVEMPAWVAKVFADLPIPATYTDAQGRFRLVGIVPGNNLIATTRRGLLADIKPTVKFTPGEVKDLGTIRLREGEELTGKVLDTNGKPVADAEVVAGSTSLLAPVDFAVPVGRTDAEGRFSAGGFADGKVTVAARRSAGDRWVLAEPQSILGDAVVTLPARATLTVHLTFQNAPVAKPKLRLLPNGRGEEALTLLAIGFQRGIDLSRRMQVRDDGAIEIGDLEAGAYLLLATADGAAMSVVGADLTKGSTQVAVALDPSVEYAVRVLGPDEAPIRNASIYVVERGKDRNNHMPLCAGRTGADGRLSIHQAKTEQVRISAAHPRWGTVHGEAERGKGELLLRMQQPGAIEGRLTEGGKPPVPGKHTIGIEYRPAERGAIEDVPTLTTADLEGNFAVRALQPGKYTVHVIPSLEALGSPGGVMNMAQSAMVGGRDFREETQVTSGGVATVTIEVGKTEYTGPAGSVFGSIQVDGQLGVGYRVRAWTENGQLLATADAAGRFDLGRVPAGSVHLNLMGPASGLFDRGGLWNASLDLKEAESREIVIDLQLSTMAGIVLRPDGSSAAGIHINANGRPLGEKDGSIGNSWRSETTDAEGRFRFSDCPTGIYHLQVNAYGEQNLRGQLDDVRVEGGRPVENLRLQLQTSLKVSGTLDLAAMPQVDWCWISFHEVDPKQPDNPDAGNQVDGVGVRETSFETFDLKPGRYYVKVHANVGEQWSEFLVPQAITVPEGGVDNLLLRPVPRQKGG